MHPRILRRFSQKDGNHDAVGRALIDAGLLVEDTHTLPNFVDFVVCIPRQGGRVVLVDAKDPKQRWKATKAQLRLFNAGWPIVFVTGPQDAVDKVLGR